MSDERPEASADSEPELPRVDLIDWLLYVPFICVFFCVLLVFEVAQRIAFKISRQAHQTTVRGLNRCLRLSLRIVGTRFVIETNQLGAVGVPHILISNHQSMFDIPILDTVFGIHQPRFIAKQELGRGIPSVSLNLRLGGAALIDRTNPRQALPEIKRLGRDAEARHFAAAIFPEGTRAKRGVLKEFHHAGISALMSAAPSADFIPIAIDGSWKLASRPRGPIPRGTTVTVVVLEPIAREGLDAKAITQLARQRIAAELERIRNR